MDNIHKLELHKTLRINDTLFVTRVPGGWIYEILDNNNNYNAIFVPFDNEFMKSNL